MMRTIKLTVACVAVIVVTSGQMQAGLINVGALPTDGTPIQFVDSISSGELDFYEFTLSGDVNNGNGTYLNIQTFGQSGFTLMDTEIGLYDSFGNFVVSDDDDNGDGTFAILYSLLTFGDSDPLGSTVDSIPGQDGLITGGAYTLVVGGFNTTFGANIGSITAGSSAGDYNIQFASQTAVPEPSTFALLSIGGIALVGYGLRKKRQAA